MRAKTETKPLITCDYKHYRPGDPEFEAIASKITPINKIRSGFFDVRTLPFIEYKKNRHGIRKENVNDLFRGANKGGYQ